MTPSTYKTKIASRYIPINPEQIRLKIMESTAYFTSVKYDGYFAVLTLKNGKVTLQNGNKKELEIKSVLEAARQIKEDDLHDQNALIMLAGGEKSNEPLVFQDGGKTYRAFLEGRINDKAYILLMHLSNWNLRA